MRTDEYIGRLFALNEKRKKEREFLMAKIDSARWDVDNWLQSKDSAKVELLQQALCQLNTAYGYMLETQ